MFSSLSTRRTRTAFASSVAVLALAGCSSAADTEEAAVAITESTIEDALDQATTSEPTTATTATTATTIEPTTSTEPAPESDDAITEAEPDDASTSASNETEDSGLPDGVITNVIADASGGRSTFDGTVDEASDLDDLVVDAWGDGGLGLHRGHAQVENVLEAFLGIDHDAMHDYMDDGFNLAALSEELGKDPDALVETLTASYAPFVTEGVDNGVITDAEAAEWIELLRTEFIDRVYWDGVSTS